LPSRRYAIFYLPVDDGIDIACCAPAAMSMPLSMTISNAEGHGRPESIAPHGILRVGRASTSPR
jgi:hypothetical protein